MFGLEAPANLCRKLSLKRNSSVISTLIAGASSLKALGEMQAGIKMEAARGSVSLGYMRRSNSGGLWGVD